MTKMPNENELSDYLRECIEMISKHELLRLNVQKVCHIISNDLNICLENVSLELKHILCECFCYYMKVWPGWRDYHNKCVSLETTQKYHAEFKKYLQLKLKFVIQHTDLFFPEDISGESNANDWKILTKPEAPYTLVIEGQPSFLNNIAFLESNGDVLIQEHSGRSLSCVNINQLLNYPSIRITVRLLDMEFSRSNSHKFKRYISESRDEVCPEVQFIDYVERICSKTDVKVYTSDYIIAYYKQFIEVAKKLRVDLSKLYEIEMACKQFVRDIQESNVGTHITESGKLVNTIATNTAVSFNIGKNVYFRNKKMALTASTNNVTGKPINFCETIIPRMVFSLLTFTAEQDLEANTICFKRLKQLEIQERKKLNCVVSNAITYECLYCSIEFTGDSAYAGITAHFKEMHKGEQSVVCFKCRKNFMMSYLAGGRWSHDCDQRSKQES